MKNLFSKIITLCLLLACVGAHSEIYSWVDKEGKKHFGEKIPKEYLKQSTIIDVKPVNSMQAEKVSDPPPPKTNIPLDSASTPPEENHRSQNLNSCELQKQAYENSVRCFSRCQNGGEGAGYVNNVSGCSHCTDVKKPDCS